jgi:hypothetical protein
MTDPDRVVDAVTEIVTAVQGASPAAVGRSIASADQMAADAYYEEEAKAFVATHPDYYPVPQNQEAMFAELQKRGYDLTRNNLAIVFEALQDAGELVEPPPQGEEEETPPAAAAPPTNGASRPRSYSSGMRNSDASASRPAPVPRKPLVTRADLEKMSRAEYNERLRDPAFRKAVDALN